MNKSELIDKIIEKTASSKADATKAVDAVLETILETLKRQEDIALVGFGTFLVRRRAARNGRNPKTGEEIRIKAINVPAFKASKLLKEAINL